MQAPVSLWPTEVKILQQAGFDQIACSKDTIGVLQYTFCNDPQNLLGRAALIDLEVNQIYYASVANRVYYALGWYHISERANLAKDLRLLVSRINHLTDRPSNIPPRDKPELYKGDYSKVSIYVRSR